MTMKLVFLALAMILTVPLAASSAATLFDDASGDAGPKGVGTPAFAHADLLESRLLLEEGPDAVEIDVAQISQRPTDTLWGVTWTRADGTVVLVAWMQMIMPMPPFTMEGAIVCEGAQTDESACADAKGERTATGFHIEVPRSSLGNGTLTSVGGMTYQSPMATMLPIVGSFTSSPRMLDAAQGADVDLTGFIEAEDTLTITPASDPGATRTVPGPAFALVGISAAAAALLRARRS